MVSKTKTKTRKKGKQTRGAKKTKPAKNRGTKKTSARLARPKRVSRTKRSNAQRSRIASPSEQDTKILDQGNASSLSSSAETVGSNEHQGEVEAMRSNTTLEEITTDQSSQTEENVDDYNTGTSEIV